MEYRLELIEIEKEIELNKCLLIKYERSINTQFNKDINKFIHKLKKFRWINSNKEFILCENRVLLYFDWNDYHYTYKIFDSYNYKEKCAEKLLIEYKTQTYNDFFNSFYESIKTYIPDAYENLITKDI